MPTVLAALIDTAGNVGLPVLFILIAVETMGIPLPGETALVTMAILASKGKVSIEAVIIVTAVAAIIGDNIGYYLGRRLGREIVLSDRGPYPQHRRKLVEAAEPFFEKHGPKAVFLGRWFSGLRICAAWMAGIGRMHWATFGAYNAAGGILWATSIGLAAYYAGEHADKIIKDVGVGGAFLVVVGGALAWAYYRRRRASDGDLFEEER